MKTTHDDIDQAKPTVLFLCSRNSARSQIAEGILRSIAGDSLNVLSAGLEPSEIHPMTREVMAEIGIPLDSHRSKGTHEYLGRVSIRHAVIVCEKLESQCPTIYPFAIQTHYWPFEDPASTVGDESQQRDAFRNVRDQIEAKIRDWINSGEVK